MRKIKMNKIREVLQLKQQKSLSYRQVESLTGVGRTTQTRYVKTYLELEVSFEEIDRLSDKDLDELFHPPSPKKRDKPPLDHPDWNNMRKQLSQKGMTRLLLWEECKQSTPALYGYSQFNRHFNAYLKQVNPSMRQIHYSGDKLFIDYSGLTMPIVNQQTGEVTKSQIFVSVLGAGGLTFVHATSTQSTQDFISSHVQAFNFYGGVPNILVPDNLKAAVISHKKGIVKLNVSYEDMGRHYGVVIKPARPYKPQDKSKVELGVKAIQRWILMRLRHHTFFSVDELNQAINELLDLYNDRIIKRLGKSRTQLFKELDQPMLHPLPANGYIYKQFKTATVAIDYHIELEGSGYSVPYTYLGKKVDVSYSNRSVTISYEGTIIANHPKQSQAYHDSTIKEHMPTQHQYQHEKWNPRRILNWANGIGVHTTALMQTIMEKRSHEVRAYKSCMAILSFSKTYGTSALEQVAQAVLEHKIYKVSSIESMLKTKRYLLLEQTPVNSNTYTNGHENIRGSDYYTTPTKDNTK